MYQSISQSSPVSNSTKIPTGMAVASSHLWSDSRWGYGSGAFVGAVITGSVLTVGGSGVVMSVVWGVGGLCSGFGCKMSVRCGWMRLLSCSALPTRKSDPFIHSAKLM